MICQGALQKWTFDGGIIIPAESFYLQIMPNADLKIILRNTELYQTIFMNFTLLEVLLPKFYLALLMNRIQLFE